MSSLASAAALLINVLFGAYIFVLLLRLLLQKVSASFHNPISQVVIKITEPVVKPCRKFLPGCRGVDLAIIFVALVVQCLQIWLLLWMSQGVMPGVLGVVVVSIGELGNALLNVYFFAMIMYVLMSWVTALQNSPAAAIVTSICQPLLRLISRFIPPIGGFDLSPIVVLLAVKLIAILVCGPIVNWGVGLT